MTNVWKMYKTKYRHTELSIIDDKLAELEEQLMGTLWKFNPSNFKQNTI